MIPLTIENTKCWRDENDKSLRAKTLIRWRFSQRYGFMIVRDMERVGFPDEYCCALEDKYEHAIWVSSEEIDGEIKKLKEQRSVGCEFTEEDISKAEILMEELSNEI